MAQIYITPVKCFSMKIYTRQLKASNVFTIGVIYASSENDVDSVTV
jgi:hypothetical protein